MTSRVLTCTSDLVLLRAIWPDLSARYHNPLLDYDWFVSCAESFHDTGSLQLITECDGNGHAKSIAPMAIVRENRTDHVEILGSSQLSEPTGLLLRDPTCFDSLIDKIESLPYPVVLARVYADDDFSAYLAKRFFGRGFWLHLPTSGTAVLTLPTTWDEFYNSLPRRRRYDHRRATRRGEAIGRLEFQARAPSQAEVNESLQLAFSVEDRNWKGRRGSSVLRNDNMARFFSTYGNRLAGDRSLRVFFQYTGDVPVAMAVCVEIYGALWFLKIGYDEEYRQCSPGILLLMNIIDYCCTHSIDRIEHLGTVEPWLEAWSSFVKPCMTHIHYPRNFTGARQLSSDVISHVVRRFSPQKESRQ